MPFDPELVRKLEEYGKVLTTHLLENRRVPTLRRDSEVDLLERHLDLARNASFLLLGPSGCGKTAVLHELVHRLGTREHPWLVLESSTSQLMAGTQYIGEWQTRVNDLIRTARRSERVAVYLTDVFNMIGAGRHSKSDENMATFVARYVESGDLLLLGECTPDTFRQGVDRHPWFKKLFSVFRIDEQQEADIAAIVRGVAEALAAQVCDDHGVTLSFPDNALAAVRQFGKLYFAGTAAPGGAVKLLEYLINAQVSAIEKGKIEIRAATVRERSDADDTQRPRPHGRGDSQSQAAWVLGYDDVIRTLESFTGIPSLLLDDSQALKTRNVRQFFESRVIGQQAAVDEVIDLITLIKAGVTDPKKPMGILFFVGPTGVGKTELAKALAEFIFGSADRMFRFDMSEFKEYDSYQKLIGMPHAQADSPLESGTLLAKVRQQPFSVILLDEIEKAHANIFDILLQLCDDGRLTDPHGRTTNFTQTIVVMTSNLGSNLNVAAPFGFNQEPDRNRLENTVREAMEEFFRPEFLNRIDRVITFRPLEREHVRILAQRELGSVLMRSGIVRRGLRVDVDPGVIDILAAEGFSPMLGARPLKRAVERYALVPLARQIVQLSGDTKAMLRLLPAGDRINVRLVEDRETRQAESIERGVTVVDPIRHRKDRVTPTQIDQELLQLTTSVEMLERQCRDNRLEETKSSLVAEMSQPGFWDDPNHARDARDEVYRIERILEAVASVRREMNRAADQVTRANKKKDAELLADAVEKIRSVRQHADVVQYSLNCRDRLDRCDAFVAISAVGDDIADDHVGQLADMYANWARLKGFESRIVHEDLAAPKITRELILVIEGVAIYGLLSGEEGIHEIVYGKTSKSEKATQYVRVRVLPLLDDRSHTIPRGDLAVKKEKGRGTGRRCKRYRSDVRLTHRPSSMVVSGRSDLSPEEAEDLLQELLQAELHRSHYLQPGVSPTAAAPAITEQVGALRGQRESIIRKYTLRPAPSARDPRTGVATNNLNDLWNGALDEFLHAALQQRQQRTERPREPAGSAGTSYPA